MIKPKLEGTVTLGNILVILSLIGGFASFALARETRLVKLEEWQVYQKEQTVRLSEMVTKTAENQSNIIRALDKLTVIIDTPHPGRATP